MVGFRAGREGRGEWSCPVRADGAGVFAGVMERAGAVGWRRVNGLPPDSGDLGGFSSEGGNSVGVLFGCKGGHGVLTSLFHAWSLARLLMPRTVTSLGQQYKTIITPQSPHAHEWDSS